MLRSQRRGRDPPCWLSEKEPLVGKRRVNFQRCWLPVSRIGLHRRGVERVNCGPKLLDLGEKGVYSSYTSGMDIPAIARQRELTETTVFTHLAGLIEQGQLDVAEVVEL